MAEENKKQQKGDQAKGKTNPKRSPITPKDTTSGDVFEDIFEHIDVDSIAKEDTNKDSPTAKKSSNTKATTAPKKTAAKKTSTKKKTSLKANSESPPSESPKKESPQLDTLQKKQTNNKTLNIEDISAYIASTKAKQETQDTEPQAKDGTKLQDIPNIYAVVPHVKGDHKLVFLREDAPTNLLDDEKNRIKGTEYIKKGMKIYDVHTDFKHHPTLQNSNGEALGVWLIDNQEDLSQQIAAIQAGKGGGTNFGAPLILGATQSKKNPTPKKESVSTSAKEKKEKTDKKETNKEKESKPKNKTTTKQQAPTQDTPKKKNKKGVIKDTVNTPIQKTQEDIQASTPNKKQNINVPREEQDTNTEDQTATTKPRETPLEEKTTQEKKPRAEEKQEKETTPTQTEKPWETNAEKAPDIKEDDITAPREEQDVKASREKSHETAPITKPRAAPIEEKSAQKEKPRTQPNTDTPHTPDPTEKTPTSPDTKKEQAHKDISATPTSTLKKETAKPASKEPIVAAKVVKPIKEKVTQQESKAQPENEKKAKVVKKTEEDTDKKSAKNNTAKATKEVPFYNAVEKMHEHDVSQDVVPTHLNLDDLIPTPKDIPNTKAGIEDKPNNKIPTPKTSEKGVTAETNIPPTHIPSDTPPDISTNTTKQENHVNIDDMFSNNTPAPTPPAQKPMTKISSSTPEIPESAEATKTTADLDNLIGTPGGTTYPAAQVTQDISRSSQSLYEEHDEDDDDKDDAHKTTKQKVRIAAIILAFFLIIGGIIWVIRIAFFSNTGNESTANDIRQEQVTAPTNDGNTIPNVIPEDEVFGNPNQDKTELSNTPPKQPDTKPLPETEPTNEAFTLPELAAKLEAQQGEASRLVKDAKFIGSKEAIMFATTAAVRANSILSDIEDGKVSASEVQASAEKIDFYLQQANNLLQ